MANACVQAAVAKALVQLPAPAHAARAQPNVLISAPPTYVSVDLEGYKLPRTLNGAVEFPAARCSSASRTVYAPFSSACCLCTYL